jgi:hypothetical protein
LTGTRYFGILNNHSFQEDSNDMDVDTVTRGEVYPIITGAAAVGAWALSTFFQRLRETEKSQQDQRTDIVKVATVLEKVEEDVAETRDDVKKIQTVIVRIDSSLNGGS